MRKWPRLVTLGSVAGLAAWLLVLVLRPLFGIGPATFPELLFGVALGASLGGALAVVLGRRWDRTAGPRNERS